MKRVGARCCGMWGSPLLGGETVQVLRLKWESSMKLKGAVNASIISNSLLQHA